MHVTKLILVELSRHLGIVRRLITATFTVKPLIVLDNLRNFILLKYIVDQYKSRRPPLFHLGSGKPHINTCLVALPD